MKNTIKVLGVIAVIAVLSFSMIACDNGSSPPPAPTPTPTTNLSGTWVGTMVVETGSRRDPELESEEKLVLDNGNYTNSSTDMSENNAERTAWHKGTYTNTASYITRRATHVKLSGDGAEETLTELGLSTTDWIPIAQYIRVYVQHVVDIGVMDEAAAEAFYDERLDYVSSQRTPYTLSGNTLTLTTNIFYIGTIGPTPPPITFTKQ